ncbi:hypothetical protein [Xylella fastidiosa]|uniref:hypothetical protein n=1 Tax=Xylella fastidiosa TaxID=2371 RepID=UPI000ADB3BB2|nr:hypothetical protein [Xylella fastidiosa]
MRVLALRFLACWERCLHQHRGRGFMCALRTRWVVYTDPGRCASRQPYTVSLVFLVTPKGWATWAMQMHGAVVMGGMGSI